VLVCITPFLLLLRLCISACALLLLLTNNWTTNFYDVLMYINLLIENPSSAIHCFALPWTKFLLLHKYICIIIK
jgi:hypothetical protein